MSEMNRREALTILAIAPFAAGAKLPAAPAAAAVEAVLTDQAPALKFFTAHEYATVKVLADIVLPADERSGSATAAGVPEFIDFMLADPINQGSNLQMRGGLAWLDAESYRRHQKTFLGLTPEQRTGILDDIAWPARARPEMSHGVAFFNRFRDWVANGFWSSQMGVRDLQYMGNVPQMSWNGCPPEALRKLGLPTSGA